MIEEMLAEKIASNNNSPISQEDYDTWRSSDVTKRLFDYIEITVLEDALEDLASHRADELAIDTAFIKGKQSVSREVLDWAPAGCKGANDED